MMNMEVPESMRKSLHNMSLHFRSIINASSSEGAESMAPSRALSSINHSRSSFNQIDGAEGIPEHAGSAAAASHTARSMVGLHEEEILRAVQSAPVARFQLPSGTHRRGTADTRGSALSMATTSLTEGGMDAATP